MSQSKRSRGDLPSSGGSINLVSSSHGNVQCVPYVFSHTKRTPVTLNTALVLGTDIPRWYITSKKTSNYNKMNLTILNDKPAAFYLFRLV